MVINHNIMAMNTYRQMGMNQRNISKSIEKLSSGMRINRAGDDAAGLAISEKMRGQIRGLNQASRNAQDGISLIQTAEGALAETHSILQRMRELAVQAGNDTYTAKDREEIQNEINQLTKEVTRIGDTTEFNKKKLLNAGTSDAGDVQITKADKENMVKALQTWWFGEGSKVVKDSYGLEVPDGTEIKIVLDDDLGDAAALVSAQYKQDGTSTTGITGKGMSLELHVNLLASKPLDFDTDKNGGKAPQYVDRVIVHEMTHAIMSQTMNFGELNTWFKEGAAEFAHGADERLKQSIDSLGGIDKVVAKIGDGTAWGGDSDSYSAAYLAVRYMDKALDAKGGIEKVMDYLKANDTATLGDALNSVTSGAWATEAAFITDFKASVTTVADAGIDVTNIDTGSVLGSDNGGATAISAEDVVDETGDLTDTLPTGTTKMGMFNVVWPDLNTDTGGGSTVVLQIGANAGQTLEVKLQDMRADALGVANGEDGLDISNQENVTKAIKSYDEAIKKVSTFRSKLGAFQNRLEHTIKNLDTSAENLQAAESRIRDVDMAKEMMEFQKNNILSQVAQAMLAQANQQSQGVLQLLR